MKKYSILIPAYNEEKSIADVLKCLENLEDCEEIIVVDDGSTDDTPRIATTSGARLISHPYNRGYGAALKTGILACRTTHLICFDADGQHSREDLLKIAANLGNSDMVVGSRTNASHKDWLRMPGKAVLGYFANLLSDRKIPDLNSGLRSFNVSVIRKYLHIMPNGFSFTTTSTLAMFSTGHSVLYLPITTLNRTGRSSSVRIMKDGLRVAKLILNLTILFNPMKVFFPIAIFFLGSSLIYFIAYAVVIRIHITESMVLLFVTGILLIVLGLISEQISALRRDLNQGV